MAAEIEHLLAITKVVNAVIGKPAAAILRTFGADIPTLEQAKELGEASPVKVAGDVLIVLPNHVVEAWLVMGVVFGLAYFGTRTLKMIPKGKQHIFELFVEGIDSLLESVIGPKGPKYFNLIGALALFILCGNLIGLLPFCESPTANVNTNGAMALFVFLYYHFNGMKELGVWKYCKHFAGPMPLLAPLMVPIEIISHLSRPLSLTVRLFGNIRGEDIVLIILMFLVPYFVPLPMMVLMIFSSLLQTFIFIMLTMMYLAGAVAVEEH
ncbi:F0F1 ATP synthase subunit A [candidate division CSSED10-310 bacterium]|uniref:ATP synthase subunit a n=1 Tax=candidate division CSSED10-310 bacterium TaxID=2855610 RepID=A0ABV6YVE3_UNCC1